MITRIQPATAVASRCSRRPAPTESCEAHALVWAVDERQAAEAEEFLRHRLWAYWFRYPLTEVRRLALGGPCPLHRDAPTVLASVAGEHWTWVLIAPGADTVAVSSCT